ncbi:Orf61 [Heliothis zea nudivirus]|uniref:Orf61 n=1 Tax=Heliothis zea nudivirus 1 TaxID=3116536 RepID=Q8JKQ0_9VIRU|nr:Orf61 [Heliothis zea nudivirus]AAN04355.1 Orf61 [Heliothis zea nudivirus]
MKTLLRKLYAPFTTQFKFKITTSITHTRVRWPVNGLQSVPSLNCCTLCRQQRFVPFGFFHTLYPCAQNYAFKGRRQVVCLRVAL